MHRAHLQVPELVSLLSHSYSAHMRYGACFAVGIACAGTSSPAALRLLKPLLKDKVDYVRQGAMIAESMIVMQDASHYKMIFFMSKIEINFQYSY